MEEADRDGQTTRRIDKQTDCRVTTALCATDGIAGQSNGWRGTDGQTDRVIQTRSQTVLGADAFK